MESWGKNCARATPMLRVGGDELRLRLLDVRPALQQLRREAGGQILRRGRERVGIGVGNRTRILSEQEAERIFLLLNLLLQLRQFRGCGVEQLLGLAHIRERNGAATLQRLRQVDRILPGLQCLLG